MKMKNEISNLQKFVHDATVKLSNKHKSAKMLLSGTESAEYWINLSKNTREFYAEVYYRTIDVLNTLIDNPNANVPEMVQIVLDLESNHSEVDNDKSIDITWIGLQVNYILSLVVLNALENKNLEKSLNLKLVKSFHIFNEKYETLSPDLREQLEAKFSLLLLWFKDFEIVKNQYHEYDNNDIEQLYNSNQMILKYSLLVAKSNNENVNPDVKKLINGICVITQFNYFQWIVNDYIESKIELATVVLISLITSRKDYEKGLRRKEFFSSLQPAVVLRKMETSNLK